MPPPAKKKGAAAPVDDLPLKRSRGALLGLAVGDALGGPYTGRLLPAPPFPLLGAGPVGGDMRGGGPHSLRRGQVLDDTHMACCIARFLREYKRYDVVGMVQRYLAWKPHAFGNDPIVKQVLEEMQATSGLARLGVARRVWYGHGRKAATNGSLGRTAPLGVFFARDEQARLQATFEDSCLTHVDPRCQLACVALNSSLAFAITAGAALKEPAQLISAALSGLHVGAALLGRRDGDHVQQVAEALALLKRDLELAQQPDPLLYGPELHMHRQPDMVRVTFRLAYWELMHAPGPEQALLDVATRGGDTSTNAAVTGALLGAYHGDQALPMRWLQTIMEVPPSTARLGPLWDLYHPRQLLALFQPEPQQPAPQKKKS